MMLKISKLLTVLVVTVSLNIKAQKFDAVLYFLDGSKKTGKADMVSNEETKLAFIENGSKKKEKIKIYLLDKVEYINLNNNQSVTVEFKEFTYYFLSDKPKTGYCWMKKINSGEISTYVAYAFDGGVNNGYHYTVTPSSHEYFFFQYKNEKPQEIYINNSIWTLNKKQMLRRMVRNFFKDKCPKLVSDLEAEKIVITNNNPEALRQYYNENCSTKN
ncbi:MULTISPECIES: hypothetical protein [Chryseobacterium]|uniref:GLPGLI family protein n=1 Tax=Chryseobacterium endophyticum TaxID=1854762 RepID=A0AAU6WR25_9FLAO|nr:hypothetical protein [uncultured Chryseobacterium sp.]